MQRFFLFLLISIFAINTAQAQYKMSITANYNIPISSDFSDNFQNGYGANAEIHYFLKETGFSGSLLFGLNSFRGTDDYEKSLLDPNLFYTHEYTANNYVFPVLVKGNYTFFRKNKFNVIGGIGVGVLFMEEKIKQTTEHTSETEKEKFNELGLYPSLGISYAVTPQVAVIINSGFNMSFGDKKIQYIDIRTGLIYKI